ncbi:MAG: hypothetical protein K2X06_03910 [Burkholderiales bacterium]|nr:hypothetical protein [Burkholderiales bacterium]
MNQRALWVLEEANLPWQVKASGSPDAGRHQNPNAQKALMEFLLLGNVTP